MMISTRSRSTDVSKNGKDRRMMRSRAIFYDLIHNLELVIEYNNA
jgi:hypothetical protein